MILFITNRTIITGNRKELPPKRAFCWVRTESGIQTSLQFIKTLQFFLALNCNRKGFIYKFEGLKYWSYEPSGRQWKRGQNEEDLSIPTGFNAVFHNGMANNSMMIEVSGHRVWNETLFAKQLKTNSYWFSGILLFDKRLLFKARKRLWH